MVKKNLIGVVYLLPSVGYPSHLGWETSYKHAYEQVKILNELGYCGALLENENDRPYKIKIDSEVEAFTLKICQKIRTDFPQFYLGIEFLINDPHASLRVAKASKFDFIRTDYFVDEMFRDEYGILNVDVEEFHQYRLSIDALKIKVYTDIQVKYAKMITPRPLTESARLAALHHSNGLIISSDRTGLAPDLCDLQKVFNLSLGVPIMIGSGFNKEYGNELLQFAHGAFVGQALMNDGIINFEKAENLIKAFKE